LKVSHIAGPHHQLIDVKRRDIVGSATESLVHEDDRRFDEEHDIVVEQLDRKGGLDQYQ
jgi:hypothetical protein